MTAQFVNKLRSYISRVLDFREYTHDGFPMTGRSFVVPENAITLHPQARRSVAICNLFANERKSIKEIACLLDTETQRVILTLIEEGLIADRRSAIKAAKVERRRSAKCHLPLFWLTGSSDHHSKTLCGAAGGEIVGEFIFSRVLRNEERCRECWENFRSRKPLE